MKSDIVIIWLKTEPVIEKLSLTSFAVLESRAKALSEFDSVAIFLLIQKLTLAITGENYSCLLDLPSPIFLDVREICDSGEGNDDNDDEDTSSEVSNKPNLDQTVHCLDLSKMNATVAESGARWGELERAYLRNFYKYLYRRNGLKAVGETFVKWLLKRKTTQKKPFRKTIN